jgi:hypothetical protein
MQKLQLSTFNRQEPQEREVLDVHQKLMDSKQGWLGPFDGATDVVWVLGLPENLAGMCFDSDDLEKAGVSALDYFVILVLDESDKFSCRVWNMWGTWQEHKWEGNFQEELDAMLVLTKRFSK